MEGDCWTADADNLIMPGTGQQQGGVHVHTSEIIYNQES